MNSWWFFRKWRQVERERAQQAVKRAERSRRIAEARRPLVEYLSAHLVDQAERNNFVERLNMHVRGNS